MSPTKTTKIERARKLAAELEALELVCKCYKCEDIKLAIASLSVALSRPRELASCRSEASR